MEKGYTHEFINKETGERYLGYIKPDAENLTFILNNGNEIPANNPTADDAKVTSDAYEVELLSDPVPVDSKELYPPTFSGALGALKAGLKVTRLGWNGKGMNLALQIPEENSANTLPYIYIITVNKERVPWVASQTDLLANDWQIVK